MASLVFLPFAANAQAVKIHEGPSYQTGICEPTISVDPTNTQNIYAASVLNNFYQSTDGGLTWSTEKITSPYGVWGDPVLLTDLTGRTYFFHLSDPEGTNWRSDSILDRMVCQTKDGPEAVFNDGSYTAINGKKHDKEWAALDPNSGRIGLSWTQFDRYGTDDPNCYSTILYSYSDDRGKSWSDPLEVSSFKGDCIDDDGTAEGAVPAFGLKGETYIGWSLDNSIFMSIVQKNGNRETTTIAHQEAGWTQSYAGFDRANGMPITVVDHSNGPHRGRIYVCWGDQNKKLGGEIYLSHSDNKGKTWSDPVRISKGGKSDQFLPWLTVDPTTGSLFAVYYDRRETNTPTETNTFMAVSHDGGEHWSEFKINNQPFYPSDKVFMGDYNHISAYGGVVRPIWTELRDGLKSIWTYTYDYKSLH
ncbi:MAG: hypothetical protein RL754_595 [Bacteroidota bacterium]|jgi:hypothetical protein